jgi:hypothetical protein
MINKNCKGLPRVCGSLYLKEMEETLIGCFVLFNAWLIMAWIKGKSRR